MTDLSENPPTRDLGDFFYNVPRLSDPAFEPKILEIAKKHSLNCILPKRQQEFIYWTEFAARHPEMKLLLSSKAALEICLDKKSSYAWLAQNGFPVAPYALKNETSWKMLEEKFGPPPYFAKPFDGSGTRGVTTVRTHAEYDALEGSMLLQPLLKGEEYTINFYVDKKGACRVVIPHRRLEVREGEVSTGVTVKAPYLIELGQKMATALPCVFGPFCFQVFHNPALGAMSAQSVVITDLNPRFGGGYPLTEKAGGNFAEWIVREAQGEALPSNAGSWEAGLKMIRAGAEIRFEETTSQLLRKSPTLT